MNEELKQQIKDELLQPRDMEVLRLTQRVIANENDERSFRVNLEKTLIDLDKEIKKLQKPLPKLPEASGIINAINTSDTPKAPSNSSPIADFLKRYKFW